MIRHDTVGSAGEPAWLLIRQFQHARLAGLIAEAWDLNDLTEPLRGDLRWAATHHDDGWIEWEADPVLDDTGRPIDFLEMPVEQSNPIWARSIQRAQQHSHLAAFIVARHFLELRAARSGSDLSAARRFSAEYADLGDRCLQKAIQEHRTLDRATAEKGLRYLQMFDVLSLTLCRQKLVAPLTFELPTGEVLTCRALSPCRMTLTPWRINRRSLQLGLEADQVTARRYRDAHDLKQSAVQRRLAWTLLPEDAVAKVACHG